MENPYCFLEINTIMSCLSLKIFKAFFLDLFLKNPYHALCDLTPACILNLFQQNYPLAKYVLSLLSSLLFFKHARNFPGLWLFHSLTVYQKYFLLDYMADSSWSIIHSYKNYSVSTICMLRYMITCYEVPLYFISLCCLLLLNVNLLPEQYSMAKMMGHFASSGLKL